MVRQAVSIDNTPDETTHACVAGFDDKYDDDDGGGGGGGGSSDEVPPSEGYVTRDECGSGFDGDDTMVSYKSKSRRSDETDADAMRYFSMSVAHSYTSTTI